MKYNPVIRRFGEFCRLRFVIDKAVRTRTRALVNLSAIGIVGTASSGELLRPGEMGPDDRGKS